MWGLFWFTSTKKNFKKMKESGRYLNPLKLSTQHKNITSANFVTKQMKHVWMYNLVKKDIFIYIIICHYASIGFCINYYIFPLTMWLLGNNKTHPKVIDYIWAVMCLICICNLRVQFLVMSSISWCKDLKTLLLFAFIGP